jgi:two-component system cell cycle sensor histidine kinase/response regulator CckA
MRAGELTRQLLAFGRRQMLRPHLVDLNEAVTAVDSLLRRLLGTDIGIVSELAPRLPRVKADPAQLEQVVVNLAVNARDAMQDGGHLVLRTRALELDAPDAALAELEPGRYVALEVVDTGVGMDEETAARAIEPFYTTKPLGKGTGLGLSMVYGSIRQIGGGLRIESTPGQGTTIRILFPVAAEAADPATPNGSEPEGVDPVSRKPRILLVEDEEAVANLVRDLLEDEGYEVALARHPHEALEIAAGSPPFELLITDLVMPELHGRQLAETLRGRQRDLDVLFMSGYAGTAVIERGLLEPGDPFLQKPFRLPDLLRTVRGLIDGHLAVA